MEQKRSESTPQNLRDRCAVVGLLSLIVGLGGYDWRMSLIVVGSTLLLIAAIGTIVAAAKSPRK